jgi:hypothetical protein
MENFKRLVGKSDFCEKIFGFSGFVEFLKKKQILLRKL